MKKHDSPIDFSVQVLTTGFWPTYKSPEISLPSEMSDCMKLFKDWHHNKHGQRKLSWMLFLRNATVKATFGEKSYDLQVTTLQAVALNALNGGKLMTV